MSVRHLWQESISNTENSKHTCSCRHMLQISVQLCPSVETPPLASSLGPHSLQNCLTYFQVTPHHSSIIFFIPHSSLCSFARPPLSVSVPQMSAPFSALGDSGRPVLQSGIPYHFQLLPAPPFILSRNSLRLICLPQPSPLVELSSMRL